MLGNVAQHLQFINMAVSLTQHLVTKCLVGLLSQGRIGRKDRALGVAHVACEYGLELKVLSIWFAESGPAEEPMAFELPLGCLPRLRRF